jgi:hypothetical protein
MLMFIGGAVAGVIALIIVIVLIGGSSDTRHQPYAGTPAYHPSHQHTHLGPVSVTSDFAPTNLSRSLEIQTSSAYVKYTVEGPPDAVLQDQPFITALAAAVIQASDTDRYLSSFPGRVDAGGARIPTTSYRPALSGRTNGHQVSRGAGYRSNQTPSSARYR